MKPSRVGEVTSEAFKQRLDKVNADRFNRTVWTSIDVPMRPLVFELHRIGMVTKFCCCGYTYAGEEDGEPKTHHSQHAYVHFHINNDRISVNSFFNLAEVSQRCGWRLDYFHGGIWEIRRPNCVSDDLYQKEDGIEEAIHQYEGYALAIQTLTYALSRLPTVVDTIKIIDGNSQYENVDHWDVKPKLDFEVSVEEFYETYGTPKPAGLVKPKGVI